MLDRYPAVDPPSFAFGGVSWIYFLSTKIKFSWSFKDPKCCEHRSVYWHFRRRARRSGWTLSVQEHSRETRLSSNLPAEKPPRHFSRRLQLGLLGLQPWKGSRLHVQVQPGESIFPIRSRYEANFLRSQTREQLHWSQHEAENSLRGDLLRGQANAEVELGIREWNDAEKLGRLRETDHEWSWTCWHEEIEYKNLKVFSRNLAKLREIVKKFNQNLTDLKFSKHWAWHCIAKHNFINVKFYCIQEF